MASVGIGRWRSALGDTWPHTGLPVALDYWPQSTHLVSESVPLAVCATGGGGGSQQAMFRRELDPLLAAALARWRQRRSPDAVDALAQLFEEIQHGFEILAEPFYAEELQASAVGLIVDRMAKRRPSPSRRTHWTESDARRVLTEWERSGHTLEAFARSRGLVPQRLFHELARRYFEAWPPEVKA